MSAASAFAVTFTSMTKRLLSLMAKGAPHGFLREPVSVHVCVWGRVKKQLWRGLPWVKIDQCGHWGNGACGTPD